MAEHGLGDQVVVIGRLERVGDVHNVKRWWVRHDIYPRGLEVTVVGQRTLSNGEVNRYTEGDGWGPSYTVREWCPTEHFNAYLVTSGLRNRHFYVLPDQIREPVQTDNERDRLDYETREGKT